MNAHCGGTQMQTNLSPNSHPEQHRPAVDDWRAALRLRKVGRDEFAVPCPLCGGTDRFRASPKGAYCRKCLSDCRDGARFGLLLRTVFPERSTAPDRRDRSRRRDDATDPLVQRKRGLISGERRRRKTADRDRRICAARRRGMSYGEIARLFSVSRTSAHRIWTRDRALGGPRRRWQDHPRGPRYRVFRQPVLLARNGFSLRSLGRRDRGICAREPAPPPSPMAALQLAYETDMDRRFMGGRRALQ